MVRIRLLTGLLLALGAMLGWFPNHAHAEPAGAVAKARAGEAYGKLPLRFEANEGQSGAEVKFLSRGPGYTLFLTSTEAVLALKKGVLRMHLLGANFRAQATGVEELPGTVNYFIGNDPKKWRTNVPTYGKVEYRNIYPGVDLVYYGDQQQLEYDLVVAPGADPGVARLGISGARKIQLDSGGDLVLDTTGGTVRLRKPVAYQQTANNRQSIEARYALKGSGQVTFEIGAYDHAKPLVIDPVLVYSTYLGGSGTENFYSEINAGIAVDSAGSVYVSGYTRSTDFPTVNPIQPSNSFQNAFVTKLSPDGSSFVYSTYLGGSGQDLGTGIAVDSSGNAYVTGQAASPNFPTTPGVFQTARPGANPSAFVTELSSTGSALLYSTYVGGSLTDIGSAIAVDSFGQASVTGQANSANFPTTLGAPQTTKGGLANAFVTTLAAGGGSLVFSTYLGGKLVDQGFGIALDSSGNIYVVGRTASSNFPLVTPLQAVYGGAGDAFVAKYNPATSTLVYSTYLGGSADESGFGIAVDSLGSAYVTGLTQSSDFPTASPYQPALFGVLGVSGLSEGVFVSKLNPSGSALVYSTYLGGGASVTNQYDKGFGIAVDSNGAAYVTGLTGSGNFPTVGSLQPNNGPFVSMFNPAGSALVFSTLLAGTGGGGAGTGIAVDASGNVYATGYTGANFPATPGAAQTAFAGGGTDAFVVKLTALAATAPPAVTPPASPPVFGQTVTFTVTVNPSIPNVNIPTGTVAFAEGDISMPFVVGSLYDATATIPVSGLSVGTHIITVSYSGDSNFAASGSHFILTVNQAATTTTVMGSPNPAITGQTVTLTATVAVVSPGSGARTGTVTFLDGAATLGSVAVNSDGVATFTTATLIGGSHTITAIYGGNSNFSGSVSAAFTQTVNKVATTTMVTGLPNPANTGQTVTITATVLPAVLGAASPTGSVTFLDGTATLGTGAVNSGVAAFTTATLIGGSHTITAIYGGDSNFSDSVSAAFTQTVNKVATTTTVTGLPNPASTAQTVTFTATVLPAVLGAGGPMGSVTFLDGPVTLGTGAVNSAGVATFSTSSLGLGMHTITASYSGDVNFAAGVSAPLTQTINLGAVSILVTESIKVSDTIPPLLLAVPILVTESIKVIDTPALLLPVSIFVPESIKVTDAPALAPQPTGPVNVSAQVSVTSTGLAHSRITNTFNGTLTVKNTSGQSIAGPIEIVFTSLALGVTLSNATGTKFGTPYITVPGVVSLAPGQSASVNVQFNDPGNGFITFTPVTYSGSF